MRESGANRQALEYYRKSLSLVEGLLKASPEDAAVRRQLLLNYRSTALAYAAMGNRPASLEEDRKGRDLARALKN